MSTTGPISAIGVLYTPRTAQRQSGGTAFPDAFALTQTKPSTQADVVSISEVSKARLSDPMSKYYGEVPIEASADNVAKWRGEAASISKSQGLPDGHYDFTRMSSTQMSAVISDYIGKGVSMDRLNGLMLTASQIQDFTPQPGSGVSRSADGAMDVSQWLTEMYRWDVQQAGEAGREASFLKGSVDIVSEMRKVTGR